MSTNYICANASEQAIETYYRYAVSNGDYFYVFVGHGVDVTLPMYVGFGFSRKSARESAVYVHTPNGGKRLEAHGRAIIAAANDAGVLNCGTTLDYSTGEELWDACESASA